MCGDLCRVSIQPVVNINSMVMEKLFIKNRKGQKVAVLVERANNQKGLAFVMHGHSGSKDDKDIAIFASTFGDKGFTVVRFDTTNTYGESDGRNEDSTTTNYYEDLEDVIAWARGQEWYQEPFALSGHSLGSFCIALYAERYPERVLALGPISPVVSGRLWSEALERVDPDYMRRWKETGWREDKSVSRPDLIKRLPWSFAEDRLKYDLLPEASKLTMPVLLIVGEYDSSTPPDHVKLLHDALPGPKEFHIIKNGPHTFRDPKHLEEIRVFLLHWIDSLSR